MQVFFPRHRVFSRRFAHSGTSRGNLKASADAADGKQPAAALGEGLRASASEGNVRVRSGSPSLNEVLANKPLMRGSHRVTVPNGPRRTLSMLPVEKKKQYQEEEVKLQNMALVTNWHIPFEKLKLQEQLGKGTFKIVYKGTYLDTAVAIAEIIGVQQSDFESVENELKIMQHIRHPNTLLFIGVSYDNDKFYIVTELAQLGTLEDLLKQSGRELTWRCKLRMAEEISHALAYLHDRGVFHRDLKAANVLVFPGDNGGFLLKLADFGLGFLKRETGEELIPSRLHNSPALAQVGTVWIRAPEVDSQAVFEPAAVDVFSLGMVLVDLLTDGGGEEIRWEVAYQKKDPVTGKNTLSFGLNTDHLREILSRKSNKRPPGLVALAVECSNEDPTKRPTLSVISQRLAVLLEKYTQSETVHAHLQEQLAKRETQALAASAAIRSTEGMEIWAQVSQNLKQKEVPGSVVWPRCLELFDVFGAALSPAEADVLAEAAGYADEGKIDASLFAHIWERLEPIVHLFRNEQIGYLWRRGCCALLSDRATSTQSLAAVHSRSAIVLRISTTFAGKLTISTMNSAGKSQHQLVAIDAYAVILGKGVDCRTFEGINDLFLYLVSCGYKLLVGRDNCSTMALDQVAVEMPRPVASAMAESGDSYSLLVQQGPADEEQKDKE